MRLESINDLLLLTMMWAGIVTIPSSTICAQSTNGTSHDTIWNQNSPAQQAPHQTTTQASETVTRQAFTPVTEQPARSDVKIPPASNVAKSIPLKKPTGRFASKADSSDKAGQNTTTSYLTPILSLLAVIIIIVVMSRFAKKRLPFAMQSLNTEVLDILGRKSVDHRHSILFVRVGQRILILSSSLEGLSTLAEVTDPVEVDRISGLCKQPVEQNTAISSFRMLLSKNQNSENRVDLDRRHRQNQQQKRRADNRTGQPVQAATNAFTADEIAQFEKTLQAAREGQT